MPSIRFSNHWAIAGCLSGSCALIMFSLNWLKYCKEIDWFKNQRHPKVDLFTSSLSRMSPSKGLDMDHWFLQSSNMMIFSTVDRICWRISGCCSSTCKNTSPSRLLMLPRRLFLPENRCESRNDERLTWNSPFWVSCLKRKDTMWSRVVQQPVHTIVSEITHSSLNLFRARF
jgi:hypothetical protein